MKNENLYICRSFQIFRAVSIRSSCSAYRSTVLVDAGSLPSSQSWFLRWSPQMTTISGVETAYIGLFHPISLNKTSVALELVESLSFSFQLSWPLKSFDIFDTLNLQIHVPWISVLFEIVATLISAIIHLSSESSSVCLSCLAHCAGLFSASAHDWQPVGGQTCFLTWWWLENRVQCPGCRFGWS